MKIKLLFCIPSLDYGGAEKVLVNLVNRMDKKKFDISILTLSPNGGNERYLNEDIKLKAIFPSKVVGINTLLKAFTPQFLFTRFIKEDFDVIVSYNCSPLERIVSGCTSDNVILINWNHGSHKKLEELILFYRNKKEFIESINKFKTSVFVGQDNMNSVLANLPELSKSSIVINNVIETDMILNKSNEKLDEVVFDDKFFNLISIGRFMPVKAFDRQIRIMDKLVNEDNLSVRLYLIGEGKLLNRYISLVKEFKLESSVFFLDYQENPYKFLKQSDLYVCSSISEAFSTACAEAIIVGTPVISTECDGMKEILGSNNEFGIVTDNNEESLYKGIRDLIIDPKSYNIMLENTAKAYQKFDPSRQTQKVEDLIKNLAKT